MTEKETQIALSLLTGIGLKKATALIATLGSIDAIFEMSLKEIHQKTNISMNLLKGMNRKYAVEEAKKVCAYLDKHQFQSHFYTASNYPKRLKQCDDAPLLFFSQGNIEINPERTLAIVGTRTETAYGRSLVEELIHKIKGHNITVISGMAYGIDVFAHQMCVKHDIPTIGVLGNGIGQVYPKSHQSIAKRMLDKGGLISEFLPGTKPDRENFPMRNRIVAGLCDATLVVESKAKGGSLITAQLANDYNREVFAFPGNINQLYSEGCNLLIKNHQAHLLLHADNLLQMMGWEEVLQAKLSFDGFEDLSEKDRSILKLLQDQSDLHIDHIGLLCNVAPAELNFLMMQLELKGLVKTMPGKRFGIA
jgi:DNA processing protein